MNNTKEDRAPTKYEQLPDVMPNGKIKMTAKVKKWLKNKWLGSPGEIYSVEDDTNRP